MPPSPFDDRVGKRMWALMLPARGIEIVCSRRVVDVEIEVYVFACPCKSMKFVRKSNVRRNSLLSESDRREFSPYV